MIKTTTTLFLLMWATVATITHQPIVQASPNECEFLIVSIQDCEDKGLITAEQAEDLINTCAEATWGD